MNQKDREHLAYFITAIESDCNVSVAGQLNLLIDSLNDKKFNDTLESHRDFDKHLADESARVMERAVSLWVKDHPEHEWDKHNYFMYKTYRQGDYGTVAREQIEYEDENQGCFIHKEPFFNNPDGVGYCRTCQGIKNHSGEAFPGTIKG